MPEITSDTRRCTCTWARDAVGGPHAVDCPQGIALHAEALIENAAWQEMPTAIRELDHAGHHLRDDGSCPFCGAAMTSAETAAGLTRIGSGVYLTPSDAAMSRPQMAAWFRMRGVHDLAYLDELLNQYAGKTEDEMDEIYSQMHGSMA